MDEEAKKSLMAMGVPKEKLDEIEREVEKETAQFDAAMKKLFSLEGLAEVALKALVEKGWKPGPTPQRTCGLIPPGSDDTKFAFAVGLGTAWQMALDGCLTMEMCKEYMPKKDENATPTEPAPAP